MWRKYLDIAWVDNKNANDIAPKFWIVDCPKMYNIYISNIMNHGSHENWKMELTAREN